MARTGRPRIHEDDSARMRKRRQDAKREGKRTINVFLTDKHKKMLDALCNDLNISQAEAIGYLLECAYDRELPNLLQDSDGTSGDTAKS